MIKWFRTHKGLRKEIGKLNHQIEMMQEHIHSQKVENLDLQRELELVKKLLDISENTKRY
jgi:regulator of replication initiation timing